MDLAKEWKRKIESASSRKGWDLFYNNDFCRWYDLQLRYNNYPGMLLDRVLGVLNSRSTLLDIGAGTGAFAIPAAERISRVTAVEPSAGMLALLMDNMNGQKNINIIEKSWEDIAIEEIEKHDIVFAANSLYRIIPIVPAVKKMIALSRKYICIIMSFKSSLYSNMWDLFKREEYHPPPSFIDLYNILYSLDIIADIEIIRRKHSYIYRDIEQALDYWSIRLGLNGEDNLSLKKYLEKVLKKNKDVLYYEEEGNDAIIWYQKK